MARTISKVLRVVVVGLLCMASPSVYAEAMLQYFNTSWREITEKMPELAEAGYSSLWIPPPTKASGGLSVGYDLFDPFDLGGRNQRGTVTTRYGSEAELLNMIETAHRFGIRVYADNIMNHRAFDIPGYNETTSVDVYPGMVPEDFHLRRTEDGFYRKWDNTRDWNDAWQVMNLGLSDLIDIAHETPNANHGLTEGSTNPKPWLVRHPNNPEFYDHIPNTNQPGGFNTAEFGMGELGSDRNIWVGFGPDNGITTNLLQQYANFYKEDVGGYLVRAVRWKMHTTRLDGLRLDAVKHVPDYFFGAFGSDTSHAGYTGNAQWQFNMTRGFNDWDYHRDSNFNTEMTRNDALLFGEHLGQPPGYGGYWSAGMRLVDNDLRNQLNSRLGSMWEGLNGFDNPGWGGFAPNLGVMHAQSHDNDYAARRELQHAFYFLREGLGLLYTDGNYHAETLGESGGAFPRWANTSFLGQWGDLRVPNLLYIHEQFGRGYQRGVWSDGDYVAWERLDWRQAGSTAGDHVTMLVMLNDNYDSGQLRAITGNISFPAQAGGPYGADAYLYNYSTYGGGFYTYASALGSVIVPAGGYFVFGYKNPDPSSLWAGSPVTIYENGKQVDTILVPRKDGPDGDQGFNPYGLPDDNPNDFTYSMPVPRITSGTNVIFNARVDGSAGNILMRLNGGIDLNNTTNQSGDAQGLRDNPPGVANDVFLGFEQAGFVKRIWAEKFAAVDSVRNKIGSMGAETYIATIGTNGFTYNQSTASNNWDGTTTVSWIYHDPTASQDGARAGNAQFWPPLNSAANATLYVGIKTPKVTGNRVHLYYTTNGVAFPEGAGGSPANRDTRVVEATYVGDGDGSSDWWEAVVPAMPAGTVFRYKVGSARQQGYDGNGYDIVWPGSAGDIERKLVMMGEWQTTNQNLKTKSYHKHNDYNSWTTNGLPDGMHLITARAFLNRNDGAAIYNTFKQTFYLDTETPRGYVQFPASNSETLYGTEYGVVVRTDPTVREVWYRFEDSDSSNDSTNNANGTNDVWQLATRMTPGDMDRAYPQAWRFTYANLPTGGTANIRVRLREVSSAPRTAWTNAGMKATNGHYTELVRTVNTRGDAYRLYVEWPSQDGALVEAGWNITVKYSSSFASGLDDAGALNLFTIRLNSTENGGPGSDGVVLSHDDIDITHQWNWPNENTITFKMPNVYNGQPAWLHSFEITGQRSGYPTLRTTRQVTTRGELLPSIIVTQPPEFGSDGKPYEIVLPDVPLAQLATNPALRTVSIQFITGTNGIQTGMFFTSPSGYTGEFAAASNELSGSSIYWNYVWSNVVAGTYRFTAWVRDAENKTNTASRTVRLKLLQVVDMTTTNDFDHDDDGLGDVSESTQAPLPNGYPDTDPNYKPNPENWSNGDVHIYYAYGKSLPESPDTDGDGLSDGLEAGWRTPSTNTDVNADTNGDGWKNFMADLDPPFFNTLDNYNKVPGVDSQSKGGDRARLVRGTMTDPSNPDTDGDGIPDGIEDWNRNGWVDGDGAIIQPGWDPWLDRDWPDGEWDALWTETDPNQADTDGDGLTDGFGEDKNFDGWIAGDVNSNRVWEAGEQWTETDPLNPDTDGDGLPDGWEVQYGLDPLDDGTLSLRTGGEGDAVNGAAGDPDGDMFSNLVELQNGTNPRVYDDPGSPPPAGSITIGRGEVIGVINGRTNYVEFTDWVLDDLLALDNYNTGGSQAVDIYRRWDGFDSSRDMVAFYMRDGGASDGKMYFRVDFHDLQAFAEQSGLNVYVVIDFNSPGAGERVLPDEVDTRTDMRWEAVVAVYDGNNGNLYVDNNPAVNTDALDDSLATAGVAAAPGGYLGAYFNSELDAVEFAIDRTKLTDIGWNGNADLLNFQVFTVKDQTGNGGDAPGDIGGRSDITDSIRTDWIASDYWRDQDNIAANGILNQWIGKNDDNDLGKSAKIAMLAHGNQHLQPGSVIQNLVNNGQGAGYQRPVQIHGVYQAPLNLHITPTLAMALEWAEVATNRPAFRSGPALNALIRELVATNVISLLGSTYADHIIPYFPAAFNNHNAALASETLNRIYGANITSNSIFWSPERVLDATTFSLITNMGFRYTILDQNTHIFNWYGRTVSLGDDGYRINRINNVNTFVINNAADGYRFVNYDSGIALPMRELFSRRARAGRQDQVSTIFTMWEDFNNLDRADAYDRNLRWLANRPWIQLVALEDIAAGNVALPAGQSWEPIDRGFTAGGKQSHDWLNHASNESYDNWYNGSGRHEGLLNKKFAIRPGVTNATPFGKVGVSGIASAAWARVSSIAHPDVAKLAAKVMHASVFQTAFHTENNNDLTRWSFGGYIYPASDAASLIDFAKVAQSQTRMAAIYAQVDTWAGAASGLTTTVVTSADSDLDGEAEYWLYNQHVAAMFERIGGRMVAAWRRDGEGRIMQMIGNLASYAGSETEEEGVANTVVVEGVTNVASFRTSALKDWWAGTNVYINDLYTVTGSGVTNGWRFTSSNGNIAKTVTLDPQAKAFAVNYTIAPLLNSGRLYVRNGLSPNLAELMVTGQSGLTASLAPTGAVVSLATTSATHGVRIDVQQGVVNTLASDITGTQFDTVPMRNQAQTHQVELTGTNNIAFTMEFFASNDEPPPPAENDGVPVDWLTSFGYAPDVNVTNTLAANGINTLKQAYIAGLNPTSVTSAVQVTSSGISTNGFTIFFDTVTGRQYSVEFKNALMTGDWSLVNSMLQGQANPASGDGTTKSVTDTEATTRTNRFYRFSVELE